MPKKISSSQRKRSPFSAQTRRWALPVAEIAGYAKNISDWSAVISGVLKPRTKADVVAIIRAANRHGVVLHPLSVGANWGFGSKLPPRDRVWLVDLSALRQISGFDPALGVVTIEPGVTQGMLDDFLQRAEPAAWCFNVTGSGRATSLVGNILQRGIGYFGLRTDDLLALDLVRGDGRALTLPEPWSKTSALYPHGLGPDWRALIAQSDLGIVTSMTLRLRRRAPAMEGFLVQVPEQRLLPKLIDVVAGALQEGWLTSVPHIGSRRRTIETLAPHLPPQVTQSAGLKIAAWSALIPLFGPEEMVEAAARALRERLGPDYIYGWLGRDGEGPLPGALTEQLAAFVRGRVSDVALASVALPDRLASPDLDESPRGLRYLNALIPLTGAEAMRFLDSLAAQTKKIFGDEAPSMTLNAINGRCLAAIISLAHERTSAGIREADRRFAVLAKWLLASGYAPYRLTHGLERLGFQKRFESTALTRELKKIWDPRGVLA